MDATPEQTMSERCVTITLDRYNELIEKESKLELFNAFSTKPEHELVSASTAK